MSAVTCAPATAGPFGSMSHTPSSQACSSRSTATSWSAPVTVKRPVSILPSPSNRTLAGKTLRLMDAVISLSSAWVGRTETYDESVVARAVAVATPVRSVVIVCSPNRFVVRRTPGTPVAGGGVDRAVGKVGERGAGGDPPRRARANVDRRDRGRVIGPSIAPIRHEPQLEALGHPAGVPLANEPPDVDGVSLSIGLAIGSHEAPEVVLDFIRVRPPLAGETDRDHQRAAAGRANGEKRPVAGRAGVRRRI